jgi:hypothetical protein
MTDRLSDYDGLFLLAGTVLAIVFGQSLLIAWLVSAWRRNHEPRDTDESDRPALSNRSAWFGAAARLLRRCHGSK